ncbi:MAG TPA: CPBP family intramembrane glutamic endopeptidase [Marmoricola sp.]|nr:CPBP family intramembrane glutamic endopeptidase [Marmoricola sp.]
MQIEVPPAARGGLAGLPDGPREYHGFYRTPRLRWWHPVAALLLFLVCWGLAVLGATVVAVLYEVLAGGAELDDLAQGLETPALFLANNIGIALAVPAALLAHALVFGQRPGWLFSIHGRFRWALLGRVLLLAALVHAVALAAWLLVNGTPEGMRVRPDTWFLLAAVLLTTPLQAAGEEVAFRGLGTRIVGAWFTSTAVGLVAATATTTLAFVLLHGAQDLWLNVFYTCLALAASVLTWRTGGLEAAIALHVVVNLTTMLFLPFLGLAGFSDRGAGTGGAQAAVQVAAVLVTMALVGWQARRSGLPVRSGPLPLPAPAARS